MRVLCGFPGWGWKMYGLASFRIGRMWFVGFSKQLQEVGADDTADDLSNCPQCGGEADNGHDRCCPPTAYLCSRCSELHKHRSSGAPRSGVAWCALLGPDLDDTE